MVSVSTTMEAPWDPLVWIIPSKDNYPFLKALDATRFG